MTITIVGTGYVGLVSGTCFAELGSTVYCVDNNESKIASLRKGVIPIYEPHLSTLVKHNVEASRLFFTGNLAEALPASEIIFIAVGTPPDEDGSADLRHVLAVAEEIGRQIDSYKLVVVKSTVPVGTCYRVKETIQKEIDKRGANVSFDVASNPEFLKEGAAIDDFMKPDRVVVGVDSDKAKELMTRLYQPMMLNNFRVLFMDIASSELTKYAANAMLATRISFMNELSLLCEKVGADIHQIRQGIGSDERIGSKFLYAGCGYGGSCFPKDVKALIATGNKEHSPMQILEAVEAVNEHQKTILFQKFRDFYGGDIAGKHVALWGLSFKPQTDDMREAPSIVLIKQLLEAGCTVSAFDPVAMQEAKRILGDSIHYASTMYEAVKEASAIFHVTEWKEFRMPDWTKIASLVANPLIIDGRNVYKKQDLPGFELLSIGLKQA